MSDTYRDIEILPGFLKLACVLIQKVKIEMMDNKRYFIIIAMALFLLISRTEE